MELHDRGVGPIKEPEAVADMVVDAVRKERFPVLTGPLAQTWMDYEARALERRLQGKRRMQAKLDSAS